MPADVVGRSFLVLTDTLPSRLDAVHTTRDSFRQVIAVLLRTEVPRLSIQPSLPNLGDYEMLGWQCRGVVAATEQFDRTPIPPGRTRPVRHICFIDQRPLLRGVRWVFAEHGRLGLDSICGPLEPWVPGGCRLNLLGDTREHSWDRSWVHVWPGQVLLVHLLPDEQASEADSGAPGPPHDRDTSPGWDEHSGPSSGDEHMPPGGGGPSDTQPAYHTPEPVRRGSPYGSPGGSLLRRFLYWHGRLPWVLIGCTILCRLPGVHPMHLPPTIHTNCHPCPGGQRGLVTLAPAEGDTSAFVASWIRADHLCPSHTRPVATPCRAATPNIEVSMRWHLEVLDTLLDESALESDRWAFLAATLLDALEEHFRDGSATLGMTTTTAVPVHSGAPQFGGQVLSLQACLPTERCFDLSQVNFDIGLTLDDVLPYLTPGRWPLWRAFPLGLSLHPAAEIFRHLASLSEACLSCRQEGWEAIEVYTDGSFDGMLSSWAFFVLGWRRGQIFVIGWQAGQVVTDPASKLFVGANTHDALRGEASALFWALSWLLQGPKLVPILIRSDCSVALRQANGGYGGR